MTEIDDSALATELGRFGLTDTEIRTYLAVLESGEAEASTVADQTGVSKRYVYSVCEELEEKGFLDVNDHVVPTKIRARPPDEVIELLSNRLDAIEPELNRRYSTNQTRKHRFDVIKSRVTLLRRLNEYIEQAEQRIVLTIPHSHLSRVSESLQDAVDRDLMVLVLVTETDPTVGDLAEYDRPIATVLSAVETSTPVMVSVDRDLGLITCAEMMRSPTSDNQAISLVQEWIVPPLYGSFLAYYWIGAEQLAVTEPRPLPQTYEMFGHGVLDATIRLQNGEAVVARVSNAPTAGVDSSDTVTGTVIDTYQTIVDPIDRQLPIEHALVLDSGEGEFVIGGADLSLKEYQNLTVTLDAPEE